MKNTIPLFVIFMALVSGSYAQNTIYLDQISVSATTTILQTGSTNRIGSSGTPSSITGDTGTFDIKQIGAGNLLDFTLTGDDFDVTLWNTGDNNTQKIYLSGDTNFLDWTATGNSNDLVFNSDGSSAGTTAATSDNGNFSFAITGSTNVFEIGVSSGAYNILDYTVTGDSNTFNLTQSGQVAGTSGHTQTVVVGGGSNAITVDQSGTAKQTLQLNVTGSSNVIGVTQGP
jgi:hypothetical protein